jgi:hypothetical protein
MAFGRGDVRMGVANAGDLREGRVRPAHYHRGWLALKTHFFSSPGYRGAFVVRARSLAGKSPVRLGAEPHRSGPLIVRAEAGAAGWREFPYFSFVRKPGCYGWQIDGARFSESIVLNVLGVYDA